MKPGRTLSLLACTALTVAACAPKQAVLTSPPPGYLQDAPARAAAVDWSKAETVMIELSEYTFTPDKLTFAAAQPHRLQISNKGSTTHTFTSEAFFKAIAARKLHTPQEDVASPYLANLVLAPGGVDEIEFVAVTPGTYSLECSEPLHAAFGMTGEITIR
jgi:uncharacterized cupredoxin-like copper-binding protein